MELEEYKLFEDIVVPGITPLVSGVHSSVLDFYAAEHRGRRRYSAVLRTRWGCPVQAGIPRWRSSLVKKRTLTQIRELSAPLPRVKIASHEVHGALVTGSGELPRDEVLAVLRELGFKPLGSGDQYEVELIEEFERTT